jgi:hypothetical protein
MGPPAKPAGFLGERRNDGAVSWDLLANSIRCGQLLVPSALRAAHAWSPLSGKAAKGISYRGVDDDEARDMEFATTT